MFRNVAAMVDPPRVGRSDRSPWSPDEARQFLAATRGSPLYAAYVPALGLGRRRGEVLGLSWADVDLDKRTVRVRRRLQRVGQDLRIAPEPKSHRRVIPLPRLAVVALRWHGLSYRGDAGEEALIFTTSTGRPIEPRNFSRSFTRVTHSADLRRVRLQRCPAWVRVAPRGCGGAAPSSHGDPGAQPDRGEHERVRACGSGRPAASAPAR